MNNNGGGVHTATNANDDPLPFSSSESAIDQHNNSLKCQKQPCIDANGNPCIVDSANNEHRNLPKRQSNSVESIASVQLVNQQGNSLKRHHLLSVSEPNFDSNPSAWFSWSWLPRWCPTSTSLLKAAEKKILSYLHTEYISCYVNIGPVVGETDNKIWTVSMNHTSAATPLLMVHGFGSGIALWCLNLDVLAEQRPIYAIDLLGFARSSRPEFDIEATVAEGQFVDSIESWRKKVGIKKFILLGHSLGGFLAASYSIKYPENVAHLVLADPWGFPEHPPEVISTLPLWARVIGYLLKPLNPFWGLRVAGPFGPKLVEMIRPDLIKKFAAVEEPNNNDSSAILNYIFHCNAQTPSGETAFHSMMTQFGWAKHPMLNRLSSLPADVPITFIYGSRSWIDPSPAYLIQQTRPHNSYVNVFSISGAGHHVYADKSDAFNLLVNQIGRLTDERRELASPLTANDNDGRLNIVLQSNGQMHRLTATELGREAPETIWPDWDKNNSNGANNNMDPIMEEEITTVENRKKELALGTKARESPPGGGLSKAN